MQGLLEIACEKLQTEGGSQIHRIRLQVGLLSGVAPDSLEFAFEGLKIGTPAEQATLEIERLPGSFSCSGCGLVTQADSLQWICPNCGGPMTVRDAGRELQLTELEIA